MQAQHKTRYRVRRAVGSDDLDAASELRFRAFHRETYTDDQCGRDTDEFDAFCHTYLIECAAADAVVGTFRVLPLASGKEIGRSYSAQFYDLEHLAALNAPLLELGRFCVAPGTSDPDVLRVAWGALADIVDEHGAEFIFGCSSFAGTDSTPYEDAFALLKARHLAPGRFLPRRKAPEVFRYAARLADVFDHRRALRTMPPLLRSYLSMGGWVSDHAVVDSDMNTLHVFTGLEVGRIPASRARVLRAVAS